MIKINTHHHLNDNRMLEISLFYSIFHKISVDIINLTFIVLTMLQNHLKIMK